MHAIRQQQSENPATAIKFMEKNWFVSCHSLFSETEELIDCHKLFSQTVVI